jgi:FtsH-binding integral membrane protein
MMMGLIGMIVVSLVNFFMGSETISYIIGVVGVLVFTGLTAYDVQKLKNIARGIDANGDALEIVDTRKLAIMGAFSLYLDFINLFLSLLRVFGRKN